jgi:uncharacterized BrkB/YihY/UPF0761 family membrane protein
VFLLFLLIYRILPNAGQTWRSVVPGTLMASVLLLVLTQVFPLYVALFPPNHPYALFGVFLVLTFWLYLLGIILVLGVELNAFLEQPALSASVAATAPAARAEASPMAEPARGSMGGHVLGFAGLVVAALLLRGQAVKVGDERAVV